MNKLSSDNFALLSAILASNTGDLTLSVTRAMCPTPEALATAIDGNPALGDYLAKAVDLHVAKYIALKGALTAAKPSDAAPIVPDAAPGSMRDKILAYLKDHPKSTIPAMKLALFPSASGGGIAAAIKVALDKKQIVCHEPTVDQPLKSYSLTEDYARSIGAK